MDGGLGCLSPKRVIYACSHLLLIQELLAHIRRALAPDFYLRLGCLLLIVSFGPSTAQHFVQGHQVLQLLGLHLHLRLLG